MAMAKSTKAMVVLPAFFILNAALSLLNRWSLGIQGFRFPLLVTASHAVFCFLFMLPAIASVPGLLEKYRRTAMQEWRGVVAVGILMAANIALTNSSLTYISLSLNQVIRASIPLVTAIMSAALERRMPQRGEFLGLVVLCLGVTVAIGEATATGDARGITLCLLSVIAGAAMLTASARVLCGRVNSVQLAFFTCPVTCACLLPPSFVAEREGVAVYMTEQPGTAIIILVGGSVLAGVYNIVHNDLVAITDPVTTCVLGQLKIVMIMVLSAYLFGEGRDWTLRMSLGSATAILGFSLYSWAKIKSHMPRKSTSARTPKRRGNSSPARRLKVVVGSPDDRTPPATLPGMRTPNSRFTGTLTSPGSRSLSNRRKTPGQLV